MEVEPKSLNLINDLRKLIPLNVRALSDFALGGGGEFTEDDLSMGDRERLLELTSNSVKPGRIGYEDYMMASDPVQYQPHKQEDVFGWADRNKFLGSLDITDPYYNLATFLGQAGYKKDKEGILNITDSFDFNEGAGGVASKYANAFEDGPVEGIMNIAKYFKDSPSYSWGLTGQSDEDRKNLFRRLYSTLRYAGGQFMDTSKPIGVDIKI